jgi:hypothetical protein
MGSNQYASQRSSVEKDITGIIQLGGNAISGTINAGQTMYVNFANDPELPNVLETFYSVPSTNNDVLFGIYTTGGSLTVDGYLKFIVDEAETNIVFGALDTTNINLRNPVQFDHEIFLAKNQHLKVKFVAGATVDGITSSQTETVKLRIMVSPLGVKTIVLPKR